MTDKVLDFPHRKMQGGGGIEVSGIEYIIAVLSEYIGREFNAVLLIKSYDDNITQCFPVGFTLEEAKMIMANMIANGEEKHD